MKIHREFGEGAAGADLDSVTHAPAKSVELAAESGLRLARVRRRPGENKRALIAAATTIFASQGYHRARTAEIAEHAGVPQPHVYSNFANKQELFLASFLSVVDELVVPWQADPLVQSNGGQRTDRPLGRVEDAAGGSAPIDTPPRQRTPESPTPHEFPVRGRVRVVSEGLEQAEENTHTCWLLCLQAVLLSHDAELGAEVKPELSRLIEFYGEEAFAWQLGRAALRHQQRA